MTRLSVRRNQFHCSPDHYCYWQSSDFTSDLCRLATSLLKYTCSIIVGIYLVIYLSSLLSALGSNAVRYYKMLVGVAHELLKLKI